jgi:glutathione S-transferase
MAATLRLYTGRLSMFGMKAEIALREKELPFERIEVPYDAANGYHPKHPDVLRINPKAQVPVLIDGDLAIYDSTQIFEYLEDIVAAPALWPVDHRARARARLLEHASDEIYFPHVVRLMGLQAGLAEPDARREIIAAETFCLGLEHQLADAPFFFGAYSFADIAVFMAQLFGERMGAPLTEAMPQLKAWRLRVGRRPQVLPVIVRLVGYLHDHKRFVPSYLQDLVTNPTSPSVKLS